jgi:hypothetical protein
MSIWSTMRRIRIVRIKVSRRRPCPVSWRTLAPLGLAVMALVGLVAAPAVAASSGSSTGTVEVVPPPVYSVTVSPATFTFGSCRGGSSTSTELGFPNGICNFGVLEESNTDSVAGGITITNTGEVSQIDVNGANAIPSDAGTPWTLCNGTDGTTPECSSKNEDPGVNQFIVDLIGSETLAEGGVEMYLSNSPSCDVAFAQTSSGGCSANTGSSQEEEVGLIGPASSTDTSPSFSTAITWTAVPAS